MPQTGFGQYGNLGTFPNGGLPFQGGNFYANPSTIPSSGYAPASMMTPFSQSFGFTAPPANFGYQPPPFMPGYSVGQPSQFFPGTQPSYSPQVSRTYEEANYFGSGSYGRPRSRHSSRHSSRHRSSSRRRHQRTSSSSSNEEPERYHQRTGSPYAARGSPYNNRQSSSNIPSISPRTGSPIPPQSGRPLW
jgi:hypothetical protein